MHVGHTVKDNRYLLQIPSITPMDLIISKAIVEVFITATIYVIFTILFILFGIQAMPVDVTAVIEAFAITFVMGLGLGALCATLQEFGSIVEHAIGLIVRVSYFASGIFYVPAMMPAAIRSVIAWNPFLHVIDMNRIGYFRGYMPFWYNPSYALMFSLVSIMIGSLCLMAKSRQMRVHK
jgi:capsular polysaccharide transport system permease protein